MKALDDFYGLVGRVAREVGGPRLLKECSAQSGWPRRGVYFFFEDGEFRRDGSTPRVVRVGTHGLRPSKSSLWGRLSQHRGSRGGMHPGGGNHRGSIFRLHVGQALAASGRFAGPVPASWGQGSSAPPETRAAEYELERAVSNHIGAMPVVWLSVEDPASRGSDRGLIERAAIALLSNRMDPEDPASSNWLGGFSHRETIQHSGLWNVNHVGDTADERFLEVMDGWISDT